MINISQRKEAPEVIEDTCISEVGKSYTTVPFIYNRKRIRIIHNFDERMYFSCSESKFLTYLSNSVIRLDIGCLHYRASL